MGRSESLRPMRCSHSRTISPEKDLLNTPMSGERGEEE